VHGLRGHPRHTWEDQVLVEGSTTTATRLKSFATAFRSKSSTSTAGASRSKVFWPDEYLTHDFPEARVWTYGYDADAIGGLLEVNNKNSISQHGRDLAVRIEREIENEVGAICRVAKYQRLARLTDTPGPDFVRGT
jgi:hypothetical protein